MYKMAAGGGEDFMSDEIVTNKCCVCSKKNRRTEADKYCVDCKDYFCKSCVDIHAAIPATEGHTMLDKSNFKSVRSGAAYLPSFPTQRCDQHKSEVLNMYCQDHDGVGCATCIANDHRSCNRIFSIPENIDKLYKNSEISILQQNISFLEKKIEAIRKTKESHAQALSKSLQTAVDSIKTFKQDLQLLLNRIEEKTIAELRKEFSRIDKSVADEVNNAVILINELKKMTAQLKNTEGNKVQEFVCAKTFATLNKKYEKDLNQQQSDEALSFAADQSIKQFLQQMKSFGKVTCQSSPVPETRLAVKTKPSTPTITPTKTTLCKETKMRKVNVKIPDDTKNCNILGSCVTEEDSLLLADYGNQKLKRLKLSSETITDFISLRSPPNAVCQVSKTEAVVSLLGNTVQFVTLGVKMSAGRTLTFNHCCEGLAHYNNKLFISDRGKTVYIHDMNGKEQRKITTNASGKDIFEDTGHIAVSIDGSSVFVADYDNGLITLDIHGNYLSTHSEKEIKDSGCRGVCTDGSNVFVCGRSSDNVFLIGQDHKLIGQITIIRSPLSVCFDSQKRRLFVTNSSNEVSVLELV